MRKIIYLLGVFILGMNISCENEAENATTADSAKPLHITGQWEVTAYKDSTVVSGPFKVITLKDPSSQSDSITIKDAGVKFWEFQSKASVNEKEGTFQTEQSNCEISEEAIGIKISNGKVYHSDSIYFEIEFEDDEIPYGNTYRIKGYRING